MFTAMNRAAASITSRLSSLFRRLLDGPGNRDLRWCALSTAGTPRTDLRLDLKQAIVALGSPKPSKAPRVANYFPVGALTVDRCGARERLFIYPHSRLIAGGDGECDIVIRGSQEYAMIFADEAYVVVTNLGSGDQTQVNGEELAAGVSRRLRSGDVVQLGTATTITFREVD